jgi:hypothetical protein
MKLHIQYLRSLEESERVRKACLAFLQTKTIDFYPERPDIFAELQKMAAQFQGRVEEPRLRRKYAWMVPLFGWNVAKSISFKFPLLKDSLIRNWEKALFKLEARRNSVGRHATNAVGLTQ